jgi:hypothetical protein
MPAATADLHPRRFCGGNCSRLRGRKAHSVLVRLLQGFRNLRRQRRIRLLFDPFLFFCRRFHLRNLAFDFLL